MDARPLEASAMQSASESIIRTVLEPDMFAAQERPERSGPVRLPWCLVRAHLDVFLKTSHNPFANFNGSPSR